jgi:hypothetical protein
MPDNKDAKTEPAAHEVGTEVSTNSAEYNTGPTSAAGDGASGDKTYYLKEGAAHYHIEKGEPRELNRFGDKATLSAEQAAAFKDKFLTEQEYKAIKAGRDSLAEGAQAAELAIASRTQENTTPEEAGANANDPKPAGKANAAGVPGKPEEKK